MEDYQMTSPGITPLKAHPSTHSVLYDLRILGGLTRQ